MICTCCTIHNPSRCNHFVINNNISVSPPNETWREPTIKRVVWDDNYAEEEEEEEERRGEPGGAQSSIYLQHCGGGGGLVMSLIIIALPHWATDRRWWIRQTRAGQSDESDTEGN